MQTLEFGGISDRICGFIGMVYDNLGRPDRALSWYDITAKLQSRPGDVAPFIGDCWTKLGDDEQAFAFYNRAIELQPNYMQGAMGKCRLHLLRGEFQAAREICRTRVRDQNELGEMAQVAVQIAFFSRNYEPAKELYVKLLKSDADGGGSFYGAVTYRSALGRIDQTLGADDEATELLQA